VSEQQSGAERRGSEHDARRAPVVAASYQDAMKHHLPRYRETVLYRTGPGMWRRRDRTTVEVGHILPGGSTRLNIVPRVRDAFWTWFDTPTTRPAPKLHPFFGHLTSSQAFAFNLFFPFLTGPASARTMLLRALGLPLDAITDWAFEAIVDRRGKP
jgi:hypothetical protein